MRHMPNIPRSHLLVYATRTVIVTMLEHVYGDDMFEKDNVIIPGLSLGLIIVLSLSNTWLVWL